MPTESKLPNILQYTDLRSFLLAYAKQAKTKNRRWTLSVWARALGLKSRSTLNMLLSGQRKPGKVLLAKLEGYFSFSSLEREHFRILAEVERKTSDPQLRQILLQQKLGTLDVSAPSSTLRHSVVLKLKPEQLPEAEKVLQRFALFFTKKFAGEGQRYHLHLHLVPAH